MLTSRRHTAVPTLVVAIALSMPCPALAEQGPGDAPQAAKPPASGVPASPAFDVSLERIRRQLRETPPTRETSQSSLLKLEYYVQVVGTPPPIDFFKDFNIGRASSVQYGGMTHAEFLRITAPFWRKW